MRVQRLGLWAIAFVLAACASSTTDVAPVSPSGFRHGSAVAVADPTVRPARVVPEAIESKKNYGIEAGQGPNADAISRTSTRLLTAGFRVLVGSDGSVRTSADRFPSSPRETLALPDRLGGGFLFVTDDTSRTSSIWRAERWTDPARRIAQWQEPIEKVMIGLDRVYVRTRNGLGAVDAVTGAALDRGALPTSPQVEDFVAEDAWRAVAIEDLRGVVATFDAGATWRVLDVPTRVSRIVPTRDGLVLGRTPAEPWFLLKRDGSVARLSSAPREVVRDDRARAGVDDETRANDASPPKSNATTSPFGTRPLTAAIEDGWPLEDGTAVVARDGALGRIRLDDGSLVESVEHAFPMPSSKCHAVALARPTNPGAFGFVCGTYAGPTAIYAYDAKKGALVERKRFESPRVVVASGNGALVVKGRCASDPEPTNDAAQAKRPMEDTPTYCVGGVDDRWREIRLHGGVGFGARRGVGGRRRRHPLSPFRQGRGAAHALARNDRHESPGDVHATLQGPRAPAVVGGMARRLRRTTSWRLERLD